MKIIVDTNIVFSGILNQNSRIGELLISEQRYFDFYSCYYLQIELKNHYKKLAAISKQSIHNIVEIQKLITRNIKFIDEILIPRSIILDSERLVEDVDFDDVLFVALSKYLKAKLWTGDRKLINGLKSKGFDQIIITEELIYLLKELKAVKR